MVMGLFKKPLDIASPINRAGDKFFAIVDMQFALCIVSMEWSRTSCIQNLPTISLKGRAHYNLSTVKKVTDASGWVQAVFSAKGILQFFCSERHSWFFGRTS